MIIINNLQINTEEELELAIVEMTEETKTIMRNNFHGIQNLPPAPTMLQYVTNKIKDYQVAAKTLLVELYAENTVAGLTTAQSDQMFDDFDDVLTRLREGAFPTALYRLNQKVPAGFVTQQLIDSWKVKIQSYL